jgi:hypothetical protein
MIPEVICPKRTTAGVTSGVVAAAGVALPRGAPALGSVLDAACALCATPSAMSSKDAEIPAHKHDDLQQDKNVSPCRESTQAQHYSLGCKPTAPSNMQPQELSIRSNSLKRLNFLIATFLERHMLCYSKAKMKGTAPEKQRIAIHKEVTSSPKMSAILF